MCRKILAPDILHLRNHFTGNTTTAGVLDNVPIVPFGPEQSARQKPSLIIHSILYVFVC